MHLVPVAGLGMGDGGKRDQRKILSQNQVVSKYTMLFFFFLSLSLANLAERVTENSEMEVILFLLTEESLEVIIKLW